MASTTLPPTAPPLQIHTTLASLRAWRRTQLLCSRRVALVPTMGALHAGHLSLIRAAAAENPSVVVSIFVNPAQFAPHEDLTQYPRTLDSDVAQLEKLNAALPPSSGRVEALFLPSVTEMYPSGIPLDQTQQRGAFVSVHGLSEQLEGVTRPHFFRGVATVCMKLFNAVQPDAAFFGQKDVQQTVVLRRLVQDLLIPVELRICETVREGGDGLAMSSRNVYLGDKRRGVAGGLYRALRAAEEVYKSGEGDRDTVLAAAEKVLENVGKDEGVTIEVEYLSLADGEELNELQALDGRGGAILSGAVRIMPAGERESPVRIIDNIILKAR
ncbi:pantoate-beta-alanine ligase [Maublancomyces gigas]|uniref:Pantoate--beta-alanine ligase n=1 Tax=Discina gigas TaxID=1032678 RepID=A0ABR3GEI9_9PEZI